MLNHAISSRPTRLCPCCFPVFWQRDLLSDRTEMDNAPLGKRFQAVLDSRYFLYTLISRDLRLRYAGLSLGALWNLIHPFYFMVLYTLVFGLVLKVKFKPTGGTFDFVLYLFAAFIPWMYFQDSLLKGINGLIENSHFIKKTDRPLDLYIITALFSPLVPFVFSLSILWILLFCLGKLLWISLIMVSIPFIVEFVFTAGLCFLLSPLNVFFRDISQITTVILNTLFFITPIVYPTTLVPERFRFWWRLNPLYGLVEAYRTVLIEGRLDFVNSLLYPLALSVVCLVVGYWLFLKTEEDLKDLL